MKPQPIAVLLSTPIKLASRPTDGVTPTDRKRLPYWKKDKLQENGNQITITYPEDEMD